MQSWSRRGQAHVGLTDEQSACLVRCHPEDGLNGFFVAQFRHSGRARPAYQGPVAVAVAVAEATGAAAGATEGQQGGKKRKAAPTEGGQGQQEGKKEQKQKEKKEQKQKKGKSEPRPFRPFKRKR